MGESRNAGSFFSRRKGSMVQYPFSTKSRISLRKNCLCSSHDLCDPLLDRASLVFWLQGFDLSTTGTPLVSKRCMRSPAGWLDLTSFFTLRSPAPRTLLTNSLHGNSEYSFVCWATNSPSRCPRTSAKRFLLSWAFSMVFGLFVGGLELGVFRRIGCPFFGCRTF